MSIARGNASELFQPLVDDKTHAPVTGNEQDVSSAEVSAMKNRSGGILHFKEKSERDRCRAGEVS